MKLHKRLFESSVLKIYKELPNIVKTLKEHDIEFVIIGGISARSLKLRRETEDLDLLISIDDKKKFFKLVDKGYHSFKRKIPGSNIGYKWIGEDKVDIDVLFSKTPYNQGKIMYDDPGRLLVYMDNYPYLKLESFIKYKLMTGLEANRHKDFGDVQEIIRIWKLPRKFIDNVKTEEIYKQKYRELWDVRPQNPE